MENIKKIIFAMIALSFAAGIYFYPLMPDSMASHWNANGQVNGYMPKFLNLFLLPIITLITFLLFIILPKIDPLKTNYVKFKKYYNWFLAAFTAFMLYIYALTIIFNQGIEFNMTAAIIPALTIFFYLIGTVIGNAKQNWFIGIRTPWTLSSEKVWDKTNKLGGKIFKIFGIASLLGIFFGELFFIGLIISLIAISFYLVIYSYFEFKKTKD